MEHINPGTSAFTSPEIAPYRATAAEPFRQEQAQDAFHSAYDGAPIPVSSHMPIFRTAAMVDDFNESMTDGTSEGAKKAWESRERGATEPVTVAKGTAPAPGTKIRPPSDTERAEARAEFPEAAAKADTKLSAHKWPTEEEETAKHAEYLDPKPDPDDPDQEHAAAHAAFLKKQRGEGHKEYAAQDALHRGKE
jgi:hypothetical protein